MSKLMRILNIFFLVAIMTIANAFAIELPSTDDGTDKDGELIVAPTLALRCGLSSQEPNITSDCVDRLAYDNKSGKIISSEFASFDEERKAILGEYAGAYLKKAVEKLIQASGYEDKINEDMCIDNTKPACLAASNDIRAEIEYNNKLAAHNASIMLDAVKLRALQLNMDSMHNLLYNVVPVKDVDITNTSLVGAP